MAFKKVKVTANTYRCVKVASRPKPKSTSTRRRTR